MGLQLSGKNLDPREPVKLLLLLLLLLLLKINDKHYAFPTEAISEHFSRILLFGVDILHLTVFFQ